MNLLFKVPPALDAARIAHSILGYNRRTDELDLELPIPMFMDTLALKLAKVPPEDKFGANSYPLDDRSVDGFRFLLGLPVNLSKLDYFIEPTAGIVTSFPSKKLEAVAVLTEITPRLNYSRSNFGRVSEKELVVPTLRLLADESDGKLTTRALIDRLTDLFEPSGQDAEILHGRGDSYFSQKVRNMISHRNQPSSFIKRGLADYESRGLRISSLGRSTINALIS